MKALATLAPHIKKVVSFILLINVSLFGGGATADEVLRYNLGTSGSSIPYENAVDEDRAGILVEILPLIMNRAGIKT
ncbi:ABC transporter substrate-binding protein, partial [Pseudomonas sp. HMWF031]